MRIFHLITTNFILILRSNKCSVKFCVFVGHWQCEIDSHANEIGYSEQTI